MISSQKKYERLNKRIERLTMLRSAVDEFSTTKGSLKSISNKYGFPLPTLETTLNRLGAKKGKELWYWSHRETNLLIKYHDYGITFLQQKLRSGRSKWSIYAQLRVLNNMQRQISPDKHRELIGLIVDKYGRVDLSEIDELLYYLEEKLIRECLGYATFKAFVNCIKRKYDQKKQMTIQKLKDK